MTLPVNDRSGALDQRFALDVQGVDALRRTVRSSPTPTPSTTRTPVGPIYDSLGNPHDVSVYFVKSATPANTWSMYGTIDGAAIGAGALGTMTFDAAGKMTAPASGQFSLGTINLTNGAAALTPTIDISGTTQFGAANAMSKLGQDGYRSGELTSFSINADGTITGKFSNEQTKLLGQVVLSSFANPNGLEPKGNNVWAETQASGNPLTGTPGEGTKLGSLQSGALEASNVDLTSELVNLIVAQRNYQANAQTVKTQDQVMQTLMNIR